VTGGLDNLFVVEDVLHRSIYKTRPDVGAIVHHHTSATTAVAVLAGGFQCLTQDSAPVFERVAYHDWEVYGQHRDRILMRG
jgi:ribulose-5-phosphate 4-epimerase/fuculose-1-phosphate aldolase